VIDRDEFEEASKLDEYLDRFEERRKSFDVSIGQEF